MTIHRRNIYLIAGVGMIVGSFFAAAKAIGSAFALAYFLTATDFSHSASSEAAAYAENLSNSLYAAQSSNLVQSIGSFLILFLGGRWMLRGPKLLERWATHQKEETTVADNGAEQAK